MTGLFLKKSKFCNFRDNISVSTQRRGPYIPVLWIRPFLPPLDPSQIFLPPPDPSQIFLPPPDPSQIFFNTKKVHNVPVSTFENGNIFKFPKTEL